MKRRLPSSTLTATVKRRSAKEMLTDVFSRFQSKDHVLIVIDPDPDAIASAITFKRLLWHKVQSTTIGIVRPVRRLNNLTLVRLLRIPLVLIHRETIRQFDKYVIVDSQPTHNDLLADLSFTCIIDHHPLTGPISGPCMDVRPEYGSVSTIMTEYLKAARLRPSKTLATALLYGIKTDTRSFERHTTIEDIEAFRYLFALADHNILRKVEISDLSLKDLKMFDKAFERKHVVKDRIFAHIDEVPSADILVEVAEFFLKIHDISWSIVSGIYEDTLIIVVRNDGYRKDAGKLVRRAFGAIGCAGGHQAMARAEIPLDKLAGVIEKRTSTAIELFIERQLSPFSRR